MKINQISIYVYNKMTIHKIYVQDVTEKDVLCFVLETCNGRSGMLLQPVADLEFF